jgi:hypothetical protein
MSSMVRTIRRAMDRRINGVAPHSRKSKGDSHSRGYRDTQTVMTIHRNLAKKAAALKLKAEIQGRG